MSLWVVVRCFCSVQSSAHWAGRWPARRPAWRGCRTRDPTASTSSSPSSASPPLRNCHWRSPLPTGSRSSSYEEARGQHVTNIFQLGAGSHDLLASVKDGTQGGRTKRCELHILGRRVTGSPYNYQTEHLRVRCAAFIWGAACFRMQLVSKGQGTHDSGIY